MTKRKQSKYIATEENRSTAFFSSRNGKPLWSFQYIDRDGPFAFTPERINSDSLMRKLIDYSGLTWAEIERYPHDSKGTRCHPLGDSKKWSPEARECFKRKFRDHEEAEELIYSMGMGNKPRLIGLRTADVFHIVWYDPEHKFCPSTR